MSFALFRLPSVAAPGSYRAATGTNSSGTASSAACRAGGPFTSGVGALADGAVAEATGCGAFVTALTGTSAFKPGPRNFTVSVPPFSRSARSALVPNSDTLAPTVTCVFRTTFGGSKKMSWRLTYSVWVSGGRGYMPRAPFAFFKALSGAMRPRTPNFALAAYELDVLMAPLC